MKKIEKKGKQKTDLGENTGSSNADVVVGKVKDENDKPLNYIKDEIQSEWFVGAYVGAVLVVLFVVAEERWWSSTCAQKPTKTVAGCFDVRALLVVTHSLTAFITR